MIFEKLHGQAVTFNCHDVSCKKMRHACRVIMMVRKSWSNAHGGNLGNSRWENRDSQATKALIKNLALDALRIYISYTLTKFQVSSIRNEKALGFWARPKREKTLFFAFFHFQSCAHTMDGTQSAWCLLQKDVQHMWLYGSSTGQAMPCSWWQIWDFPLGNVNFFSNNSLDHTFVAPQF